MDDALTIQGVAQKLNVSPTTAYRLAQSGAIPGFKVGRIWRFWPEEVEKAIRDQDPWKRSNQARARRRSSGRAA